MTSRSCCPATIAGLAALLAAIVLPPASLAGGTRAGASAPGARRAGERAPGAAAKKEARPALPTGGARPPAGGPRDPGAPPDRALVSVTRNASGQIVSVVSASRFDVSRPLREMALTAVPADEEAGEVEPVSNPRLPGFRRIHHGAGDPVVQQRIPPASLQGPGMAAAPTLSFNFAGIPSTGATPPDNNGSVGNDQFVETVNTRYQVWGLDRANATATSLVGPATIRTLFAGFGGECEAQNSGDPIVLFDKVASRWLISQFTTTADTAGIYYQCVAVSTTADATGTYARWAFAVPAEPVSGERIFGDYPHFGVWSDAYYMMAHGFGNAGYVAALFAAMDRPRMLAGDPSATWQVIQDPSEGGHMPADLDGFAPPPTAAPGIFLSLHPGSMNVYRMKVDFALPSNTALTLQAAVPIADVTGACQLAANPGVCIPQPGSNRRLDSLGDRLMFRAAYRNYVDHESIVVSHSADPFVTGVVSGARWYEIRLSGTDASCPTYPCTVQQGTVADVAGGRSRWMPSVAMDAAENMLLGYSVTGTTNMSDNHTIRVTGRAKADPLGTMTAPELTIATGNRNEGNASRWGDYTSMTIDPHDDCTFWYVNEFYNNSTSTWSTRIASARFPAGGAGGECADTSCSARPATAPGIGTATATAPNEVTLTWSALSPPPGAYAIERAAGACGSEGLYQPLAAVPVGTTSYIDRTVQGGLFYSYRVIAAADAAGRCQALVPSACVNVQATGSCNLDPVFAGADSATSDGASTCGVRVSFTAGTTGCPLTPALRYNIYRGTQPGFVPGAANRIATCVSGPGPYVDTAGLLPGVTYYYVVRAEDESTGNGGPCNDGNEETNSRVVSGTAYGPGFQPAPGTWQDGGGDMTAFLLLNVQSPGDTTTPVWRFVGTASDAGANHTPGGAWAYRNAGPSASSVYASGTCAEMQTPVLTVGAAGVRLNYWERHQLEYHWDGIAVEYARNGGAWTPVPAPSNATAQGCLASDDTSGWENLECTQAPPINACDYDLATAVYNGPLGGGNSCNNYATDPAPTGYAHRCHPIPGLAVGDTIAFRWRFTSDGGAQYAGFYLDDIAVTNLRLPTTCTTGAGCGQPTGFAAQAADADACASTGLAVSWTAPSQWGDSGTGMRSYTVLRDGVPVASGPCAGTLPEATLACTDTPGDALPHTYTIAARNGCGLAAGSAASPGTADVVDTTAPPMSTLFAAKALPDFVFVWAATEPGVTYITYRTTDITLPGWAPVNTTTALGWTNTTDLNDGILYFYSTTVTDACGNESPR